MSVGLGVASGDGDGDWLLGVASGVAAVEGATGSTATLSVVGPEQAAKKNMKASAVETIDTL
jgi:hypothetical protein